MYLNVISNNFGANLMGNDFKYLPKTHGFLLNGQVWYSTYGEGYDQIEELEMTAEDLPINSSAPTAVYCIRGNATPMCATILKARVKDKNHIAIEKPPASPGYDMGRLVFLCAFVEDGVEFEPVKEGVTELYFSSDNDSCAGMVFGAVVRPDWYCFGINFLRMGSEYPNERVQFRLSGLPEDNVDVNIPIFFNSTSLSVYGTVVLSGTLRNGNWNASNDLPAAINGLVGRPFTKAFVIR